MKGLLIKDRKLLTGQKTFLAGGFSMMLLLMFTTENVYFSVMYGTMMYSLLTISTISMDEYENGAAYLFAMPVSRGGYVKEKYVFGILMTLCAWALFAVLGTAVTWYRQLPTDWAEFGTVMPVYLFAVWGILAVAIPLQLRFGEKSRMVFLTLAGGLLACGYLLSSLLRWNGNSLKQTLEQMADAAGAGGILAAGFALTVLMLGISMGVSSRILAKKEW